MENKTILREWFARVDSEKTGSITAPQLKVFFFILFLLNPILIFSLFLFPTIYLWPLLCVPQLTCVRWSECSRCWKSRIPSLNCSANDQVHIHNLNLQFQFRLCICLIAHIDEEIAFCRMYDFDRNGTMSFEGMLISSGNFLSHRIIMMLSTAI